MVVKAGRNKQTKQKKCWLEGQQAHVETVVDHLLRLDSTNDN